MGDTRLRICIGDVGTCSGSLLFTLVLLDECASVEIYGSDDDRRKAGVLVSLDRSGYQSMKQLLGKLEARIEQLQAAGQVRPDWYSPKMDDIDAFCDDMFAEESMEIRIGEVSSTSGKLVFKFVARGTGNWSTVEIYGFDHRDWRKAGVYVSLEGPDYQAFKSLLEKLDGRIRQLHASGQLMLDWFTSK